MSEEFPTPLEIKVLAEDYGYEERRSEVSKTLFFKETNPDDPSHPVKINIFYTTRGIMTQIPHPTKGYNELWRKSAYDSLESLAMYFEDPRVHTGKGYRRAKKPMKGCVKCGEQKRKDKYSNEQWKLGLQSICLVCASSNNSGGNSSRPATGGSSGNGTSSNNSNNSNNSGSNNKKNESFPSLTSEALNKHNEKTQQQINSAKGKKNGLERRQFNCPLCPKEGRGKQVFFKKVPKDKPIVKCPKCKKVNRGNVERLYPIPKGEEKGYGLFRCLAPDCKNTWGSSRAIMNIGQECHGCAARGEPNHFVKPFRIEVYKHGHKGIAGGGARSAGRNFRRQPRNPIAEDEESAVPSYSAADQQRFNSGGGNALIGGGDGGRGFDWVDVKEEASSDTSSQATPTPAASRLSQYKAIMHKCEGCATGLCRSRKLPISGIHDVHDGCTVSTSASIITNSEVDKSEFVDRDIDFDDWQSDDGSDMYVTVGNNGKMLRG